jgi:cytidyltransferase-like protein
MTGVIIGRFQVPYLHLGHIYLISTALRDYDEVVILLGTTEEKDERNPYSALERSEMIWKIFPQVKIRMIRDYPGDDEMWSWFVDRRLAMFKNPVLLHSRDSFKDHYKGKYPLKEVPELPGYSGTELRKKEGI